MQIKLRFSSLVVAALASWAACAGWMAISGSGVEPTAQARTIATVFPTAEAGFAPRPSPTAN